MIRLTSASVALVLGFASAVIAQPAAKAPSAKKPAPKQPAAKQPAAKLPAATPSSANGLAPTLERWSLPNGLEVVLAKTDRAPAAAVQVWYRVGSKDEPGDKRGTAHMFEHIMFKGSARVAPDAHSRYVGLSGGYSNAITTEDGTAFHNTVPTDRVGFVLELEADRMRSLVFQPKTIDAEKKVVKREIERNLRNPLYNAVTRFLPVAFGSHPYAWTSGGVASELDAIDAEGLAAFYTAFYAPSNALIVIVGNLEKAAIAPLVEKHFGSFERGTSLPRPNAPPPIVAEVRQKGQALGKLGFVIAGYRIPAASHADIYPLQLLSLILSRGESSRLYKRLVASKLAVEAGGQAIVREQLGVFMVFGAFPDPAKRAAVEKALLGEVTRVRTAGVTAAELATAKAQARAGLGFAVQAIDGLAQQIGTSWSLTGNPSHFVDDLDKFKAVTAADIKRVAGQYFKPEHRIVLELPVAETGANK